MKAYLFYHKVMHLTLAAIIANNEEEAWKQLPTNHSWCNANSNNCKIIRVVSIEEPLMFDSLLPSY